MNECEGGKPMEKCPYGVRVSVLEKEVEDLKAGRAKEEQFRKDYYADREARGIRDALIDAQMKLMDTKLDQLVSWKEAELDKPNKLLDGLVEKAVWAVGAALIAVLLAKLGVV